MVYHVTRPHQRSWADARGMPGLRECLLVGADQGAAHLEISLCRLRAGAVVRAHLHAFEESWYVLAGSGTRSVAGLRYDVAVGDFGFVPVGLGHGVRAGEAGLEWLSVRAPRPPDGIAPRALRGAEVEAQAMGRPDENDPRHRLVGRFRDSDLAPYGRISMPGYHGPNIRSISIRMLVDRLLGAQHHTLFVVEFAPSAGAGNAAKEHYHPFEEIYFLLDGRALGTLDGDEVPVEAGDLVWVGVDSTHGFVNEHDRPVRWLEVQSPVPPDSDAFFFPEDWKGLPAW
jgi:mannose-6-phosphate isomerase-like protein (cupin superfamily)